jgi:heavy metal sensor kinase
LIVFTFVTYTYIQKAATKRNDDSLIESANLFIASLTPELEEGDLAPTAIKEGIEGFHFRDRQIIVFDGNRTEVANSGVPDDEKNKGGWPTSFDSFPAIKRLVDSSLEGGQAFETMHVARGIRLYATPLRHGSQSFVIVAAQSLRDQKESLAQVRTAFLISIPFALVLASLGGYFLAHRSLAPVVTMGEQAGRISSTNLHERLPVDNERNELGRLAIIFNDLLARLNLSFEQQRRFMADASHELRTPLAIVRGEAEVALSQPERSGEDYRESLATVQDEGKRMTRIVEDLFTLARADAGQYPLRPADLYLNDLLGECMRSARSLAEKSNVALHFDAIDDDLIFRGDEALLRRMIINLLDNSIKNTPPGGDVQVIAKRQGGVYAISVEDSGRGIPAEAQSHIFERFYRADKSRTRQLDSDGSGAGLGLSIAQWIAEVHGGRVVLDHSDEHGSRFVIFLPFSSRRTI